MEQPKFDVFLAHNSQDKPQVIEIARYLKQKGLNPWLDKEQIIGGDTILEKVYSGITQSRTGAFFISRNGLGNFQENIELYTVINWFLKQQGKSKSFRVIPILLPGVTNVPDQIAHLEIWKYIQFNSLNDESALQDLIRSIKPSETPFEEPPIQQKPPINRRKFLKWVGLGTVSLITPVAVIQLTNELKSERGIDYTKLRDLLKAKNWKEADKETYGVMIKAVRKKDGEYFTTSELLNFPCTDLRTIDQLWVKYSDGHFGFSVQKEIYLSVGGKADGQYYQEAWEKFGDLVGWRMNSSWINYSVVIFDISAPRGHLPISNIGGEDKYLGYLFSCIETCKL